MKYVFPIPFFLFLMMVLPGCVNLFPPEEQPADITQSELFAKMRKASDPQGVCASAGSYVLRQQLVSSDDQNRGQQYQVEVLFQKKPYFSKTTVFKSGEPYQTTLFNGKNAWLIDAASNKSQEIGGTGLELIQVLDKIGNPAYSYADVFDRIELSQTIVGTTEFYVLNCSSDKFEALSLTVFINKNSYLTKKVELKLTTDNGVVDYTSSIDEYSLYSGLMMPQTITVETNGVKSQYRTLEFKLDVEIPPQEFELPIPWYLKNADNHSAAPAPAAAGNKK